jgi:hypothetical protein
MKYNLISIEDTTVFQLVTDTFIITLDSLDPIHNKMIEDFQDPVNIERFITLLEADPSTAFEIYNQI